MNRKIQNRQNSKLIKRNKMKIKKRIIDRQKRIVLPIISKRKAIEINDPQINSFIKQQKKNLLRHSNRYTFNNFLNEFQRHINIVAPGYEANISDLKDIYIDLVLAYFKDSEIFRLVDELQQNYSRKEFEHNLSQFEARHSIDLAYFEKTRQDVAHLYNEIVEEVGKLNTGNVAEKEKSLATLKGNYTRFVTRFDKVEQDFKIFKSRNDNTKDEWRMLIKDIKKFLESNENIFTENQLIILGKADEFKLRIKELKKYLKYLDTIGLTQILPQQQQQTLPQQQQHNNYNGFIPQLNNDYFEDNVPLPETIKRRQRKKKQNQDDPDYIPNKMPIIEPSDRVLRSAENQMPELVEEAIQNIDPTEIQNRTEEDIKLPPNVGIRKRGRPKKIKANDSFQDISLSNLTKKDTDAIINESIQKDNYIDYQQPESAAINLYPVSADELNQIEALNQDPIHEKATKIKKERKPRKAPEPSDRTTRSMARNTKKKDEVLAEEVIEEVPEKVLANIAAEDNAIPKNTKSKKRSVRKVKEYEEELDDVPPATPVKRKNLTIPEEEEFYEGDMKIDHLDGNGFFDSIKNFGNKIVANVSNFVNNNVSQVTEKFVKQYGDWKITKILIGRTPVEKLIKLFLNAVSLGKFNDFKKSYDDLYHLFMVMQIEKNGQIKYFLTEKRPNIEIEPNNGFSVPKGTTMMEINVNAGYTVKNMFDDAKQIQGINFSRYNAVTNNCQNYILALVHSLGLHQFDDFIKQNITTLTGHTASLANATTSLAHSFGRLILGKAKRKNNKKQKRTIKRVHFRKNGGNIGDLGTAALQGLQTNVLYKIPEVGPVLKFIGDHAESTIDKVFGIKSKLAPSAQLRAEDPEAYDEQHFDLNNDDQNIRLFNQFEYKYGTGDSTHGPFDSYYFKNRNGDYQNYPSYILNQVKSLFLTAKDVENYYKQIDKAKTSTQQNVIYKAMSDRQNQLKAQRDAVLNNYVASNPPIMEAYLV